MYFVKHVIDIIYIDEQVKRHVATQSQDTYDRKQSRFKYIQGISAELCVIEPGFVKVGKYLQRRIPTTSLLAESGESFIKLKDAKRLFKN